MIKGLSLFKRAAPDIAFLASRSELAQSALMKFEKLYKHTEPYQAEIIVALGGDGFMLETLHRFINDDIPVYGMNLGSTGFLMNNYSSSNLIERLEKAQLIKLRPLLMRAERINGKIKEALAINEVSLLRETRQTAKLRISIDGHVRIQELIADGAIVSTPAGSTAYNLSVHGPILPLQSNIIALTPISAFRPRRWRGAILSHGSKIVFDILEPEKRPVSAVADFTEIRDVRKVEVLEDPKRKLSLLFDPEHNLDERIFAEQFLP
jgi:NAD+ kinase